MSSIAESLANIKRRIAEAERRYRREPGSVRLLAVSKTQPPGPVREAIAAGQTAFGENQLQDAMTKIVALADLAPEWHFIGPLQSNKTRAVAANFSWVHSIDRAKIAHRLSHQRPDDLPSLNVCIEVNVSAEETKAGVSLDRLEALAREVRALPRLRLRGLMAIPRPAAAFEDQRASFLPLVEAMSALRGKGFPMDTLSMGMSADLEAAIAAGATMVRIGTAIFGPRR